MDHVCQQCGAEVEQGVPFCRKCNAPQIRVSVTGPTFDPEEARILHDDSTASNPGAGATLGGGKIDSRFARSRSLIAAAALVILTFFVPFAGFLLASMPACGALAVFLYRRGRAGDPVTPGAGARIGVVTGTFAFLLFTLLGGAQIGVDHFVLHRSTMVEMHDQAQKAIDANPNPQVRDAAKVFLTPEGLVTLIVFGIFLVFAMSLLLCGIGGALSAVLLGRPNKS